MITDARGKTNTSSRRIFNKRHFHNTTTSIEHETPTAIDWSAIECGINLGPQSLSPQQTIKLDLPFLHVTQFNKGAHPSAWKHFPPDVNHYYICSANRRRRRRHIDPLELIIGVFYFFDCMMIEIDWKNSQKGSFGQLQLALVSINFYRFPLLATFILCTLR